MNRQNFLSMSHPLLISIGMLLVAAGARAQQDPLYSMYMWNMMTVMPGYAGSADVLNVTALSRVQWASVSGAPTTHSLSGHAPINKRSLGLGMSLVRDQIGRTATTSFYSDIAYRIRLNPRTRLAFGLKAGADHVQINNTQVENTDPNDPTFAADLSGKVQPNFGFGMYLWSKRGYAGISAPKLLRNYFSTTSSDGIVSPFHQEATHLFLTAGYVFPLGTVMFKPAMMVRATEGAPLSADLSANFLFAERFWLGCAYRYGAGAIAITSLQINDQFRVGYSYDMGFSNIAGRFGGAHEFMISYDPVFTRERVRSPRYF